MLIALVNKLSIVFGEDKDKSALLITDAPVSIAQQLAAQIAAQAPVQSTISTLSEAMDSPYDVLMSTLFDAIDVDNSGSLNLNEFYRVIRQLRLQVSVEDATGLFAKIDTDASGEITRREFKNGLHELQLLIVNDAISALGLTRTNIVKMLALSATFLISLLAFVFVGVSAFTSGSAFSSVVNSVIPLAGTAAVYFNQNIDLASTHFASIAQKAFEVRRIVGVGHGQK